MASHQFTFPPPPPPPPQTQPKYDKPVAPHNQWTDTRANRGGHRRGQGNWNRGARGGRGGSNGSFGGPGLNGYMQSNNGHFQPPSGSLPPANRTGSSYPLPEYPSVQQPHYSPAPQYSYGHPASTYPTPSIAPPSPGVGVGVEYRQDTQRHFQQQYSGQPKSTPYNYNPPDRNISYYPQQLQHYTPAPPPKSESQNRPVLVGPPIRIGFCSNGYAAGDQQAQAHHHIQQQLLPGSAPPFQSDTRPFLEPSFRANPHVNPNSTQYNSTNPYTNQRGRAIKREYDGSAVGRTMKVAPAVPSFGAPLPVKPPPSEENEWIPKKKKRRHNQLGLTPKSLEHESSQEEENDADEETKLAGAAGLPDLANEQIQFSYNGQISSLRSAADIATWIEERKKRFPTRAKREEQMKRQRQIQETRQAARQALKDSTTAKKATKAMEKQKAELKRNKDRKVKEVTDFKKMDHENDLAAVATKSKLRLEKLRKKLKKEERRIAKAEAKASRLSYDANEGKPGGSASANLRDSQKRTRSHSGVIETGVDADGNVTMKFEVEDLPISRVLTPRQEENPPVKQPEIATESESLSNEEKALTTSIITHNPLTPTSQPSPSDKIETHPERNLEQAKIQRSSSPSVSILANAQPLSSPKDYVCFTVDRPSVPSSPSRSISSSPLSSDSEDDTTSSSGSSSSCSSSSAPDSILAKRSQPEKMPPPNKRRPNQPSKNLCHKFVRSGGFCPKGKRCRFRHDKNETPESVRSKAHNNKGNREQGRGQRVSLYQRLVDQELKQEHGQKKEADIKTEDV